jgi:hypothetical protein
VRCSIRGQKLHAETQQGFRVLVSETPCSPRVSAFRSGLRAACATSRRAWTFEMLRRSPAAVQALWGDKDLRRAPLRLPSRCSATPRGSLRTAGTAQSRLTPKKNTEISNCTQRLVTKRSSQTSRHRSESVIRLRLSYSSASAGCARCLRRHWLNLPTAARLAS